MESMSLKSCMSDFGTSSQVAWSRLIGAEPRPATMMAIIELVFLKSRQCWSELCVCVCVCVCAGAYACVSGWVWVDVSKIMSE